MLMDELEKQAGIEPQQNAQEGEVREPQGAQEKDVSKRTGRVTTCETPSHHARRPERPVSGRSGQHSQVQQK